jgi:hypothetical protein
MVTYCVLLIDVFPIVVSLISLEIIINVFGKSILIEFKCTEFGGVSIKLKNHFVKLSEPLMNFFIFFGSYRCFSNLKVLVSEFLPITVAARSKV